mgnify:CR=1 FL=1
MHFEGKQHTITITTGTIARVFLLAFLFYLIYVLIDIVLVVLTAVVIASSIEPLARWLGKQGISRLPAVLIIYITTILSFVAIFYLFVPPFLSDATRFLSTLPEYVESIDVWTPDKQGILANFAPVLGDSLSLKDAVLEIEHALENISVGFFQVVSRVFGGILSLILIGVLSFYLSVLEDGVGAFLRIITPIKHEAYVVGLWKRSQEKIGQWLQGQILLGLIIGILVYLGLTILGVKYAFLLSILAAVTELIPLFGPIMAATPAVLLGFADGGIGFGFLIIGLYLIIQQFENHLIYPLVVRKVVGVPPLLVILALLIGFKLAGFLGLILSVPIAAAIREYIRDLELDKRQAHSLQEKNISGIEQA